MINWLIEHYAEIAVYSALITFVVAVVGLIVLQIIKWSWKKDLKHKMKMFKKKETPFKNE